MRRFIQTLFRRKGLFLLPVVIVPILALVFMAFTAPEYRAEAVAWVESTTLLAADTKSSSSDIEANAFEAQRLNQLLSTDQFRTALIERAGLKDKAQRGQWPPRTPVENLVENLGLTRIMGVRSALKSFGLVAPETVDEAMARARRAVGGSISITTAGSNLLHITYLGNDAGAAAPLIQATVDVYKERLSQSGGTDVQQSIDFYSDQLRLQDQRQREASEALQGYLQSHPAPAPGQARPADEAARIDELQQQVRIEQGLYEDLIRTLESVRIQGSASSLSQQQRINIVDPAGSATSASFGIKSAILVALTGAVIGAIFGAAAILWLTWLDSKVRSREDVMALVPSPVHIQVPQAPGGPKRWPHIGGLLAKDL